MSDVIVVQQPYHGARYIIAYKGGSLNGVSYPSEAAAQADLDDIRAALSPASPQAEALPSQIGAEEAGKLLARGRFLFRNCPRGSDSISDFAHDAMDMLADLSKPASEPAGGGGEPACWTSEVSLKMAAEGLPAVIHAYPPPVEPVALYRQPLSSPASSSLAEAVTSAGLSHDGPVPPLPHRE